MVFYYKYKAHTHQYAKAASHL